jgi:flagellar hook-basal body complex protein FliE
MTPEEKNEMEFKDQFEKMIAAMMGDVKKALAQLKAEEQATQVIEGQHGRYLIHLN